MYDNKGNSLSYTCPAGTYKLVIAIGHIYGTGAGTGLNLTNSIFTTENTLTVVTTNGYYSTYNIAIASGEVDVTASVNSVQTTQLLVLGIK